MTLNLVKGRTWKGGACTKPVPLGQATGTSTTCPSGTGRLGQAVLVPVGQVVLVPNLSYWDWERSKETFLVPWTSHTIPTLEACPCCRTSLMTTMEPVPVQLVRTCPTKWNYKAEENCRRFKDSIVTRLLFNRPVDWSRSILKVDADSPTWRYSWYHIDRRFQKKIGRNRPSMWIHTKKNRSRKKKIDGRHQPSKWT